MAATFDCPSCGASLLPNGSDTHVVCKYCGKTVVVTSELRAQRAPGATVFPGSVVIGGAADVFTREQALEIARLIRAGQKISAIKLHREISGMGLAESKAVIDRMETLLRNAGVGDRDGVLAEQLLESMTAVQPAVDAARGQARRVGWIFALVMLLVLAAAAIPAIIGWLTVSRAVDTVVSQVDTSPMQALTDLPGILSTANSISKNVPAVTPTPGFGQVLASFGKEGIGAGMFQDARSIATDNQGRVYVGEYTGGRVQVFDADGTFLTQWMVDAEMPLRGLAADRQGVVYVVQSGNITRYDGKTGKMLGQLTAPGLGDYDDVTATVDGGLAAAVGGAGRDDIAFFDAGGNLVRTIEGAISSQTGAPELVMRLAVDGAGNTYILARFEDSIFKYGPDGRYINRWGGRGTQPGQLNAPYSIAVDGQGRVYVGDIHGIQVFDSGGRFLGTIEGAKPLAFGMVFDENDELLVAARIQWHRVKMRE